ncbi:MAG TPA: histidine phosphatase family protein [Lachnospiraceae bacterium]|nr:histidine phosphatase family protein [Lachnospiraceae bacterium]
MGYLYFTRHGETTGNTENKVCGATDTELTGLGKKQAMELGIRIKEDKDIIIDEIIASPLKRARETAGFIAEAIDTPMHTDRRIIEQNFGKYEGMDRRSDEFKEAKHHFADNYSDGESMLKVAQRVYNFLDEIKKDKNKTYLVVAHNGIARIVHSYFFDETNEEFADYSIQNCELLCYEWN